MDTVVTGGAGFIGSTLVDRLIRDGHRVHVIDNFSRGRRDNLAAAEGTGSCIVHDLDVNSPELTTVVADARPDTIFHLAAQIDVRASVHEPLDDATVNVLGTINVAEAAHKAGVRKVVFASSGGAIYGVADALPVTEDAPVKPLSQYGAAKLAGEIYLNAYYELYGLDCSHLALANAYGPRQDHRGEAGVVAVFANALLTGAPTQVFGDGGNTRDYVYVDDIIEAFVLAAFRGRPACRYNIGTGVQTTDRMLHSVVAEAAGAVDDPECSPARLGDLRASALDATAACEGLGWTPWVDLAEGVRRTVAYLSQKTAPADVP
ncbi:NAD-dependent epimerase/dehydratase family protein [Saccharopolyspora phatthalungensis]|uniref:NAD-dependent epimerase/dehydratase family protein n=1 Tax=Saccharopolyspora phatthalungensis TaxID=664693 RepID=UPI00160AE669|nr:NAD-dependent epimerase/dehydratase family protein [Saccharopolyspora phatthalungensis]